MSTSLMLAAAARSLHLKLVISTEQLQHVAEKTFSEHFWCHMAFFVDHRRTDEPLFSSADKAPSIPGLPDILKEICLSMKLKSFDG